MPAARSVAATLVGAAICFVVFAAGDPAPPEEGRATYVRQCAPCHGEGGRGDGPAAYLLYPRPRDFTSGRYKLVSTWEGVPTDEDLLATVTRGMPGSSMPAWGHLPERTRRALVAYIKSLSAQPLEVQPASEPTPDGAPGRGVVKVPPEPGDDAASLARARELFADACASCHGPGGRGDGVQEQVDDFGYPTRPRDLTLGVFKGNPSPESVYRRIISGMPGTPMPSSSWAYGDDAWHLARLVRSWSSDRQRQRVEMRRETIRATRLEKLPIHPDDGAWHDVPAVNLHLMPLWWRTDRPEEVAVRAAHDGKELALLMVWHDATDDHTALRPQDFRDAVAVQFSLDGEPPFLAMGDAAAAVNIWMWKSERQADIGSAFQEIDRIYPNIGIDSYPNLLRSPLEQPTRQAVTLQSDPTFITGWGAGNIVSDPTRPSAVEDLRSGGFGTLRARPRIDQRVVGNGIYGHDSYRVMLQRSLKGQGVDSVQLSQGSKAEVAFAVWNGSAGDRDGKKSVTIWQQLIIEP